MRIDIPVYGQMGGKLKYDSNRVIVVNEQDCITWSYKGKNHHGIGIAACARSATVYMTYLLRKLGYDVGHEVWGPDGSVGYHLVVVRPDNCLHQVRHPLKQITSMLTHRSWGFCNQVIDLSNRDLLGCMEYWFKWNQICEEFCVWRYQIEQLPDVWDEFLDKIGHSHCPLPDVPTNTNSHTADKQVTWNDLFNEEEALAKDIIGMANRYGYDTPEMDKVKYQNLRELETAEVASV